MPSKKYEVKVHIQGNALVATYGYVAKESDSIILLYVDALGDTGSAYPAATGNCWNPVNGTGIPEMWLQVSEDDDTITLISFPELNGWEIFCAEGGKTMSIAFQKGSSFE